MGKLVDRTGQRFGKLVVLRRMPYNTKAKQAIWWCKCDCGRELAVRASNLHCGQSKSCGCLHKEIISGNPFENVYNRLKESAKRRKISCSLQYEEYVEFTKIKTCFYCGTVIQWAEHVIDSQAYQLDRIDNTQGYTKSNCRVACPQCNMMKSRLSKDDFISQCKKIANKWVTI